MYILNSNFLDQLGGERGEEQSFPKSKWGKTLISLIDQNGWFLKMLYNFELFIDWLIKEQFLAILLPQYSLP